MVNKVELLDLYTKDRERTGKTIERGDPVPKGFYRLIVHICIFNKKGQMLIQQRQPFKKGWSNLWDVSVGGSAVAGDSSVEAAEREVYEELGLNLVLSDSRPALTVSFEDGFDDFYSVILDLEPSELQLQYEEVKAVKWATKEEILSMIDSGVFLPWHKSLIELLFYMYDNHRVLTD
ncbi:NUDIX hydrolase [Fusibacter tunisiensis]|uniref:Isopentenyldiphosphate isomerase n=1 Tax=Fusibacter tunisiensis TaxID=1008308 RepID=A0ABS2MUJ9_9FIRM|nr:isopentenyldiphosphate isomerase [Fusibacter tunisiensis]